ncbi:MAG: BatD family protein [Prevotella sp.]|nr:BatD family protein [Prevotella sp.]
MIYRTTHQAKRWVKWFLPFYLFTFLPLAALAQTLTGRAPAQVAVGEQFRLSYTVNTDDAKGFRAGEIPDAFDVLMGPSTSQQSSFQMVNGHTSSSSSITYTYILSAKKNGTFTIPAAHVTAGGKSITSNELHIKVSGQAQQGGQQGGHQQSSTGEIRNAGSAISGSDLFIKVTASKQHVREQEPILLTYKVYTLVGLTQLNGKMADLKSFYSREVPLPQEKQFHIENLNGKAYRTVTWQQYVVFPQTTGKLEIPSITYEGIVVQQNRNVDPFEAFFNGGSGYVEVKKQIKAPGITIQVDPLPQRPAGFSGGVGRYSISAQLDKNEVKANDPVKLRVVVTGVGNMKLLKQPEVKFPKDFDHYDAKVTDKTQLTTSGLEGSITYDFLAVPRHQGDYEIPAIEYIYFDTQANAYKTVKTEPFQLHVEKGSGSSSSTYTGQEDVKQLNSDIHYIKTGDTRQRGVDEFFFASTEYWVSLALLLLGFISLFIIFRQRAIENADIVKQRAGKANKVATKRLKKAAKLMAGGKQNEFYDEVLRALWGYVGDKLNMPVEQLSRENISQQLESRNVSSETISQFIGALDECEFARYAPGDATGNMNKVYDAAMTAITQIAATMKRGKWKEVRGERTPSARLILLAVISLTSYFSPLTSNAVTKAEADSAYVQERYQQAAKDYEALLKQGVSADLYYNLGNCYYRMDQMTQAVLNYERALLLSPGDKDIRFNLQMARSKTIDKITPESEMFFVTWYRSLVNVMSVDGWARTALVALIVAIVLALFYLFSDRIWLRKIGFFGGIIALLLFLIGNLFAWQQKSNLTQRTGAIIIKSAVNVKSTPSKNGTDLYILHEGTKVTVTDSSMREWRKIRVADGKEGWLEVSEIEVI